MRFASRTIRILDLLEWYEQGYLDLTPKFQRRARARPLIRRHESTDASKILHTILPDFFMMWDDEIKKGLVGGRKMGATYAFYFLQIAQSALHEAIETCIDEKMLDRPDAIRYIRNVCDGKSLPKLVDEYHFLKYTKKYDDY